MPKINKKRNIIIFLLFFLVAAVPLCASAVSLKAAFNLSRLTRSSLWCRLLILPQLGSDAVAVPGQLRPYCVGRIVGQYGDLKDCLAIQAPNAETAQQMRHACIDTLASRRLQPELCQEIAYPDSNWLSGNNEEYQDRCRAWSISTPEQCLIGFKTTGWAKGVAERCYQYLAVNLQDKSLCDALEVESEAVSCREAVEGYDVSKIYLVR